MAGISAAILTAGLGSRMQPLTDAVPKPLLPFLNTPLITYSLDHLSRLPLNQVAFNLFHLADTIPPVTDRLSAQFGLKPVYAREWERLGTAGGIRGMWRALGEPQHTLVVMNGDSVANFDLQRHLKAHRESGASVTLVVRPRVSEQPGRVWLDNNGEIAGLRQARAPGCGPQTDLREHDFLGVHFIEPSVLSDIPLQSGCIVQDVYMPLLEGGQAIHASEHRGFWAALDTPALLMKYTRQLLDEPELFAQSPHAFSDQSQTLCLAPNNVDVKADLSGPVFLGAYADVAPNAKVGPYVVADGVSIGSNTVVRNAILYGMGSIEGRWENCVAVAGKKVDL